MKNSLLFITPVICAALLSGCVTVEETYAPDGSMALVVDCSTTNMKVLNWGDCQKKAGEICHNRGYKVISQHSDNVPSGSASATGTYDAAAVWGNLQARTMMIQCLGEEPSEPVEKKKGGRSARTTMKKLLDKLPW